MTIWPFHLPELASAKCKPAWRRDPEQYLEIVLCHEFGHVIDKDFTDGFYKKIRGIKEKLNNEIDNLESRNNGKPKEEKIKEINKILKELREVNTRLSKEHVN
ncbi:hypothetical protein ACQKP0_14845 [Heyndrickxia sp. NPDC080065]|uniref:hypothetical protein n=1 Tax=Heyndrickxia sp. NPDC080065 TaxID=3390568 RepID=UPI003D00ED7C